MDSDAVLDHKFEETSLQTITNTVQSKLDWDVLQKPMVFNQDGPCWWCSMIEKKGCVREYEGVVLCLDV